MADVLFLKIMTLSTVAIVLFVTLTSSISATDIKRALKNKLYETSRFPRVFHKPFLESRQYQHIVYVNKKNEVNHVTKKNLINHANRKNISNVNKTHKVNKKNLINNVNRKTIINNNINRKNQTNFRLHSNGKSNVIRKRTFLATQTKANDADLDPLDRNRRKYFMKTVSGVKKDLVGDRKDQLGDRKSVTTTFENDFFPSQKNTVVSKILLKSINYCRV